MRTARMCSLGLAAILITTMTPAMPSARAGAVTQAARPPHAAKPAHAAEARTAPRAVRTTRVQERSAPALVRRPSVAADAVRSQPPVTAPPPVVSAPPTAAQLRPTPPEPSRPAPALPRADVSVGSAPSSDGIGEQPAGLSLGGRARASTAGPSAGATAFASAAVTADTQAGINGTTMVVVAGPGQANRFVAWYGLSVSPGTGTPDGLLNMNVADASGFPIVPIAPCFQFRRAGGGVDPTTVACPINHPGVANANALSIDAGDGNDSISTTFGVDTQQHFPFPLNEFGGADIDTLVASPAVGTYMDGGPGNDTITGSHRSDTYIGGPDNDTFIPSGGDTPHGDELWGGPGNDTIDYTGLSGITISLDDSPNDPDRSNVHSDVEVVIGTAGDDEFRSGSAPNQQYTFFGKGGHNVFFSGPQPDHFFGGPGTDPRNGAGDIVSYVNHAPVEATIGGGASDGDTIDNNIEMLRGSPGNDKLVGNGARNTLVGFGGADSLDGGGGNNDELYGDAGPGGSTVGTDGDDWFIVNGTNQKMFKGGGTTDTVSLQRFNGVTASLNALPNGATTDATYLSGSPGNDVLRDTNSARIEHLYGQDGNDTFEPGPNAGGDVIDGGAGVNTVSYAGWQGGVGVYANLTKGTRGSDQFANVLVLIGTQYADELIGSGTDAVLIGMGGDDTLIPNGTGQVALGDANPFPLPGVPTMVGAPGYDVVDYSSMPYPVTARYGGGSTGDYIAADVEELIGTSHDDTLAGGDADTWIYGGGGNDHLYGNGGNDHLYGEAGFDFLYGGNGEDELRGGADGDLLQGDDGADKMYWEPGLDTYDPGPNTGLVGHHDVIDYSLAPSIAITLDDGVCNEGPAGEGDCIRPTPFANTVAIIGSAFNDRFVGDGGRNWFIGFGGDDTFYGEGGADHFTGDCDGALITCSSSTPIGQHDAVRYDDQTGDVTARIGGFNDSGIGGTAEGDTIDSDIEELWGGNGNDLLTGNIKSSGSQANTIIGNDGNDRIYGLRGDDILDGGAGNDWLYGYDGNQTNTEGEHDTLFGGWGDDHLYGEDGADYLYGDLGNDVLDGGQHDGAIDQIDARDGAFTLYGYQPDFYFRDDVYCGSGLFATDRDLVKWDHHDPSGAGDRDLNGNCLPYLPAFVRFALGLALASLLPWELRFLFVPPEIDLPILPPSSPGRSRVTLIDLYDIVFERNTTVVDFLILAAGSAARGLTKDVARIVGENVVIAPSPGPTAQQRSALPPATEFIEITNLSGALDPGAGCVQGDTRRTVVCPKPNNLNVTMDAGDDNVLTAGSITTANASQVRLGADDDTFFNPVGTQTADGGAGNNTVVYNRPPGSAVTVYVPSAGTSTGSGEAGENDTLTNFNGATGSDENDTFQGTTAAERFDGGGGSNTVSYADAGHDGAHPVTVKLPEPGQTSDGGDGDKLTSIQHVYGGAGADSLTGSSLANVIRGGPGSDVLLDGLGGSDTLDNTDKTAAQSLDVTLPETGTTAATFRNAGNVVTETDTVANFENVWGGAGSDRILGNAQRNVLLGNDGADTLDGRMGPDVINGGAGNDTIDFALTTRARGVKVSVGDGANDGETVDGVSEGDDIQTSLGNDTIAGTSFGDWFVPVLASRVAARTNTFIGRGGVDLVDYTASPTAVVAHLDGLADSGPDANLDGTAEVSDTLDTTIENLSGGSGNDRLFGNSSVNQILGLAGNDLVQGGLGNDRLDGGPGTNTLDYQDHDAAHPITVTLPEIGAGATTVTAQSDADTISNFTNVTGGAGHDTLTGNAQGNAIIGAPGNDSLDGKAGNDNFFAELGADAVHGGSEANGGRGTDTMSYATVTGAVTVTIDNAANDGLASESDNVFDDVEVVVGGPNNDTMTGSRLNDVLIGNGGNDTLVGNGADDTLYGDEAPGVTLAGAFGDDSLYADGGDENNKYDNGVLVLPAGQDAGVDSMFGGRGRDFLDAADGKADAVISCGPVELDKLYYDLSEFADDLKNSDSTCAAAKTQGIRVGWSKWKQVEGAKTGGGTAPIITDGAAAVSSGNGVIDTFYQDYTASYNGGQVPWLNVPPVCPVFTHQRFDGIKWNIVETIPIPPVAPDQFCTRAAGPGKLSAAALADGRIVLATNVGRTVWVNISKAGWGWTGWQSMAAGSIQSIDAGVAVSRIGSTNDFAVFFVATLSGGTARYLWNVSNMAGTWRGGPLIGQPVGLYQAVQAVAPAAVPMGTQQVQLFVNAAKANGGFDARGVPARMLRMAVTCTTSTQTYAVQGCYFPNPQVVDVDLACPRQGSDRDPVLACPVTSASWHAYKNLTAVNPSPGWTTFIASSPDGLWEQVGKPDPATRPGPDQLWKSPWNQVTSVRSDQPSDVRTRPSAVSSAYATIQLFAVHGAVNGIAPLDQATFDPRPATPFGLAPLWSAQPPLDGSVRGTPAVTSSVADKIDVVADKDGSGALRSRTYDKTTDTWSAWTDVAGGAPPGTVHSSPAIVTSASGRVDVFERGDTTLYWNRRAANGVWSGWVSLGRGSANQGVTGTPTAASPIINHIDVFIRGAGNDAQHIACAANRCQARTDWGLWGSWGGGFTSDVQVTWRWQSPAARVEVFGLGGDRALYHKWVDATGWHEWTSLGAPAVGVAPGAQPVVIAYRGPRVDAFLRGADRALYQRTTLDGTTWTAWTSIGMPAAGASSDPAVVSRVPGLLDVFVVASDGALWHRSTSSTNGLGLWERISATGFGATPAAIALAAGQVDVLAVNAGTGTMSDVRYVSDRYPTDPPPPETVFPPSPAGAPAYYDSIRYGDVNGDRKADVCGRGAIGIVCALSTGTGFGRATLWDTSFGDGNGFGFAYSSASIALVDLNRDGKADVCGQSSTGLWCALSTGEGFAAATKWMNGYGADLGTTRYGDINGDGYPDVCSRSGNGAFLLCNRSTGTTFNGAAWPWTIRFSPGNEDLRTSALADVNGDGKADWCSRYTDGVWCALSTGSKFAANTRWDTYFADANGWRLPGASLSIRLGDVNGDGKADLCGRNVCTLATGANTFGPAALWTGAFSDSTWTTPRYASAFGFADVSGPDPDGKARADVCARNKWGIVCGRSNGTSFASHTQWDLDFSDGNGWGW